MVRQARKLLDTTLGSHAREEEEASRQPTSSSSSPPPSSTSPMQCVASRDPDTCAHCVHWAERPRYTGFSTAVDNQPEVSDEDVAKVYREYVARGLEPLRRAGGVDERVLSAAMRLRPAAWNVRYQIVGGRLYVVGGEPPVVNDHHRKRLRGVRQILRSALALGTLAEASDAAGSAPLRSSVASVAAVTSAPCRAPPS